MRRRLGDPGSATGGLFNWWGEATSRATRPDSTRCSCRVLSTPSLVDHGAGGRDAYIAAFLENVNWEVVEQRHKDSKAGRFTARF
jgi:hypothetical protein